MFLFAICVQKMDFERSQFRRSGVVLSELYLFNFSSLPVLKKSCFKAPKVTLDEYFDHRGITVSDDECGAC